MYRMLYLRYKISKKIILLQNLHFRIVKLKQFNRNKYKRGKKLRNFVEMKIPNS